MGSRTRPTGSYIVGDTLMCCVAGTVKLRRRYAVSGEQHQPGPTLLQERTELVSWHTGASGRRQAARGRPTTSRHVQRRSARSCRRAMAGVR
jgi:hypothetical protein